MPEIPHDIRTQLQAAQSACDVLATIAAASGWNHQFTLDGRFVGDLGELIAAQFFAIKLHPRQSPCDDGTCAVGLQTLRVQVKCRRKSTGIDIHWQPELLLVLEIDEKWENWDTVYNGPGAFLSQSDGFLAREDGRLLRDGKKEGRRFHLNQLRDLQAGLQPTDLQVPQRDA